MQANSSEGRNPSAHPCEPEPVGWPDGGGGSGSTLDVSLGYAKARVSRLAHTLETEVIPRLVQFHRDQPFDPARLPQDHEVEGLTDALIEDSDARIETLVRTLVLRGVAVADLYTELLAPAARRLGVLWERDQVDFATVTVGLGRLQRLMRQLSPAFGVEVEHPAHGRRIVLTQPDSDQHIFGLAMVAEFFRREGWDVLGGVSGVGIDAAAWVRRDWFDAVGFSIGSELSLGWLRDTVAKVRSESRNPALVVLVGGPIFTLHPELTADVGADATTDGRSAPRIAEALVLAAVAPAGATPPS